jgi:hypothetical protein
MSVPDAPYVFRPESTNQTLEFAWNSPYDGGSPILQYRIQLNGGAYSYTTANYISITGLTNGTTYYATVEAENAFGWGSAASFTPFEPGSSKPNPPSTVSVAVVSTGAVMISWTPPTVLPDAPINWYPIYSQSTNPADPVISVTGDGWSQRDYLITGLNSNSTYTFRIHAVNCPGWSDAKFTSSINAGAIYTSSLIVWVDSRVSRSYPGTGTTWSNLMSNYNTINYNLVNGPIFSNVTYNGTTNSAFSFDGTNAYTVNNTNLQTYLNANSTKETRELWFYWRGGNSVLMTELGNNVPNAGWHDAQILLSNTSLYFGYWSGPTFYDVSGGVVMTPNRWYHIAYQFQNTPTPILQAYINGQRTYSNVVASRSYNGSEYYLAPAAGSSTTVGGISAFFNGFIASYRWYNNIVSSNDIALNYTLERGGFGL